MVRGILMKHIHFAAAILIIAYSLFHVTVLGIGEILSLVFVSATLLIPWFVFKKNLTGMVFSGILLGAMVEFITEANWDYHVRVYIWRDISQFVVIGKNC